jgi:hypothetical protein
MSYDLDFWKYKKGVYLNNQEVYEQCSDDQLVEGLEDLPMDEIRQEVCKEFSDWQTEDDESWENPKGKGAFQVFTTKQFVRFDCYGMSGDDMNRLIDIMIKFDCPLYDPQVPERYDKE